MSERGDDTCSIYIIAEIFDDHENYLSIIAHVKTLVTVFATEKTQRPGGWLQISELKCCQQRNKGQLLRLLHQQFCRCRLCTLRHRSLPRPFQLGWRCTTTLETTSSAWQFTLLRTLLQNIAIVVYIKPVNIAYFQKHILVYKGNVCIYLLVWVARVTIVYKPLVCLDQNILNRMQKTIYIGYIQQTKCRYQVQQCYNSSNIINHSHTRLRVLPVV